MSIFEDVLRSRFPGLLGDARPPELARRPGPPMAGAVPVPSGPPGVVRPDAAPLGERIRSGVNTLAGGSFDPRLSAAENEQATREALINAGLATLMATGQGHEGLAAVAAGLMHGRQTGEQARERTYLRTQEDRIDQALKDPAVLAKLTPEQKAWVRMLPPAQAAELLAKLAFTPAPDPVAVSEGAALVDPRTGKPLFTNPKATDPLEGLPAGLKARISTLPGGPAAYAQLPPEERLAVVEQYLRDEERTGSARAPKISLQQQLTEQTGEGITRIALGDFESLQTGARDASASLSDLAVVDSLLENTPTGGVEELTMPLRRLAASLGVADVDKLGRQEAIAGISNKLALLQKEGMTGPMSDRDIMFLQQQVPRLGNTVEGNRILIRVARRVAERKIQLARLAEEYLATHSTLDNEWFRFKRQWIEQNPMSFEDLRAPF